MRKKERFNKKLLVEGNDDLHVVCALCEKHTVPETFDVIDCKGIRNVIDEMLFRLKLRVETIGIMIDADTDINVRWQSIRDILKKQGFEVPADLPKTGLIAEKEYQKVGVWIMPDNNTAGMLEDFLAFLVPDNDPLLPIARSTLNQIETQQLNKYISSHQSKALIHTWLAWQEDPGTPMGQSITKKYLSTDQATCNIFIQWLTDLFKDKNN